MNNSDLASLAAWIDVQTEEKYYYHVSGHIQFSGQDPQPYTFGLLATSPQQAVILSKQHTSWVDEPMAKRLSQK